jgi:outer membrane protein assembly factor BamD (BamD/ComL family)
MELKPEFKLDVVWLSLCNLNCFGIGYLLTGKKKRWLTALGVNLSLLLAAYFLNASRQPALWAAIFLAVFAAMATDLWVMLRKEPTLVPEKLTAKPYMLPLISAGLIMAFFGGFFAYRSAGSYLIKSSQVAYEAGDYSSAFKNLYSAESLYRLSLNKMIIESKVLMDEVSAILAANTFVENGDNASALEAVDKFHTFYPKSSKSAEMNHLAIDASLAWAQDLQSDANYQACLGRLETVQIDYPKEAASRMDEINESLAVNYCAWGVSLASEKKFEPAIEKLEIVVHEYAASSAFDEAYQAAAQSHFNLALNLENSQSSMEAVSHLLIVQESYPRSEIVAQAKKELPKAMMFWGGSLRSEGRFMDALEKYRDMASYTSDSQVLKQADDEILETIAELARDNGLDGQFVIELARLYTCGFEPVTDPSVDLFTEEQGKALACSEYDDIYIPEELQADIPGTFRYVITTEDASRRVQSCDYKTSTDTRVLERWQHGLAVTITSIKGSEQLAKKTFYGPSPKSCPYEYSFGMMVEEVWGDYYEDAKISEWLGGVLK